MRRDLQETFIRLTDASIQLAGRAMESSGWLRRAVADNTNGKSDEHLSCSYIPCSRIIVPSGDSDSIMSRETKELDDEDEKRPVLAPNANQAREVRVTSSRAY